MVMIMMIYMMMMMNHHDGDGRNLEQSVGGEGVGLLVDGHHCSPGQGGGDHQDAEHDQGAEHDVGSRLACSTSRSTPPLFGTISGYPVFLNVCRELKKGFWVGSSSKETRQFLLIQYQRQEESIKVTQLLQMYKRCKNYKCCPVSACHNAYICHHLLI